MISDLNAEPITGSFYEKELQKTSQEKFRIEKIVNRKGDKLYIKWKGYDNLFNCWINEKDLVKKWVNTFLSGFRNFGGNINVKIDLSNYATKTDPW